MAGKLYDFGKDVILISRVSTPEQVLTEVSNQQIDDLKSYASTLEYNVETAKIINSIESGFLKEDKKTGWNIVTDFIAKNPQYKTIICTEMSRLSRSKEILFHIEDFLCNNKIQLIIKDINFELFNRFGEIDEGKDIIFSLYASLAASEMRQKQERFIRARKQYRKLGYSIGGKKLFGYIRVCDGGLGKKKKYVIDEDEAALIRQIFIWYAYGIDNDLSRTSASTIALKCRAEGYHEHLHSKRNILKILSDTAYTGLKISHNMRKNPEYFNYKDHTKSKYIESNSYENTYPRIIEDSLFELVQHRLSLTNTHVTTDESSSRDKSSKHTSVLAKIIKCRFCNSFFIPDYRFKDGNPKFVYRDGGARAAKGLRKCEHSMSISMRMIDSAVWAFIKEMVTDITAKQRRAKTEVNRAEILQAISRLQDGYKDIDLRYKSANVTFERMMSRTQDPNATISTYDEKLAVIDRDKQKIDNEIAAYERKLAFFDNSNYDNLDKAIAANVCLIEGSKEEMQRYIHLLVKEIIPLYNPKNYYVFQVTALVNADEALDYSVDDAGLPIVVSEKHDGVYYLLIKYDYRNNIKARVINDNLCNWDIDSNSFFVGSNHSDNYSVSQIFDINVEEKDPTKFCSLQQSVRILDFKFLDFYDEDLRSNTMDK